MMHHIQKHILKVLTYTKRARFSEMRPPKIDSNAYSYHLKILQKIDYVEKTERGYRLTPLGLSYVDRMSLARFEPRMQPKIITMLLSQNDSGQALMWSRKKQPFIGAWSLPNGNMHLSDESIEAAAYREATEKIDLPPQDIKHVGACLIRARINGELVSYVLAHIFTVTLTGDHLAHDNTRWLGPEDRAKLHLLPATEQIINKVNNTDQFFFEEFDVDW